MSELNLLRLAHCTGPHTQLLFDRIKSTEEMIQMMDFLKNIHGEIMWTSVAGLCFALIFFIVGVMRLNEFSGIQLSKFQRSVFIPFHVLGCVMFSGAIGLVSIDINQMYKSQIAILFFGAIALLFPTHIYIAIKRRLRLKEFGNSPKI